MPLDRGDPWCLAPGCGGTTLHVREERVRVAGKFAWRREGRVSVSSQAGIPGAGWAGCWMGGTSRAAGVRAGRNEVARVCTALFCQPGRAYRDRCLGPCLRIFWLSVSSGPREDLARRRERDKGPSMSPAGVVHPFFQWLVVTTRRSHCAVGARAAAKRCIHVGPSAHASHDTIRWSYAREDGQ